MNRWLSAASAGYAAIGVAGLAVPDQVPAVFGGAAPTPDARTEIRAVYGGLPLALAGLVVTAPKSGAVPAALLSAGMAAGRATGMALEARSSGATRFFLGVEVALAVALLVGAGQERRRSG